MTDWQSRADVPLTPDEFRLLRDTVGARMGLSLAPSMRPSLERRLRERLAVVNVGSFAEYHQYLSFDPGAEEEWDAALRPPDDERDVLLPRGLPAPGLPGRGAADARRAGQAGAGASPSGAQAAPRARRSTPSPCSSTRRTSSRAGRCGCSAPTSRSGASPRRGAACTDRARSGRHRRTSGARTSSTARTERTSPSASGRCVTSGR